MGRFSQHHCSSSAGQLARVDALQSYAAEAPAVLVATFSGAAAAPAELALSVQIGGHPRRWCSQHQSFRLLDQPSIKNKASPSSSQEYGPSCVWLRAASMAMELSLPAVLSGVAAALEMTMYSEPSRHGTPATLPALGSKTTPGPPSSQHAVCDCAEMTATQAVQLPHFLHSDMQSASEETSCSPSQM